MWNKERNFAPSVFSSPQGLSCVCRKPCCGTYSLGLKSLIIKRCYSSTQKQSNQLRGGGVTHQTFFLGPKMSGVSVLLRLRHPDSLVLQWTALHFWYFRVGSNKHEVITVPQISGRTRTCHMTIFTAKTLILCETPGTRFNERKVCRSRCARAKLAAGVQLNRCFSCDVFPSRKFYVLCGSSLWCCLW